MTLFRLVKTPWMASRPWMAPLGVIAGCLFVLVALLLAINHVGPQGDLNAIKAFGLLDAGLWVFVVPSTLSLILLARDRCLPHLRREAMASVWLYIVLTLLVPAVAIGAANGIVVTMTCLLMLILWAGAGFLYATLPGYLSICVILLPSLMAWLPTFPAPLAPGYLPWAAKVAAVVVLVSGLRWRQLQHLGRAQMHGMSRPTMLVFNPNLRALSQRAAGLRPAELRDPTFLACTSDHEERRVHWRHIGPGHTLRSLHLAMASPWQLPLRGKQKTLSLRQVAVWSWLALLGFLVLDKDHALSLATLAAGAGNPGPLAMSFIMLLVALVFAHHTRLHASWRKTNTHLPLLALLPGLGQPARVRGDTLLAATLMPLVIMAVMEAVLLMLAAWGHWSPAATGLVALIPVLWAGMMLVVTTRVIAGCRQAHGDAFSWSMYPVCFVLTAVTGGWLTPRLTQNIDLLQHPFGQGLALAWLLVFVALAICGVAAWRQLTRRAHPFLASAA